MEFFRNRSPEDPGAVKDARLKEYAERTGGDTLRFWKLALGRIWGDPIMMSGYEAASRLGLSRSEVERIESESAVACGLADDDSGGSRSTSR